MINFLKFVKSRTKWIFELIFTHLVSCGGLIGFFGEKWFSTGDTTFHFIMVVLALLVLVVVPPATWYRLYRLYKKAKKYS